MTTHSSSSTDLSPDRRQSLRALLAGVCLAAPSAFPQPLGDPDRDAPGDAAIQEFFGRETAKLEARLAEDLSSRDQWEERRPAYHDEYLHMLGLSPLPEKSALQPRITSTLEREDYAVDMLHYQSRPGLYVTGNLYRPRRIAAGEKLPAVFYVCGHSHRGRNGNKVAYQSHGIWFARHGYICLVVDTLQLGEIAAFHHGTYNLQRWWWLSRGYTPAGVEAWNGVRGIDYLTSRPDVDPSRIAVTGISGGGAATFWIAAADPRVRVAVPVSGMADLASYLPNRVINGHCDCMFLHNTFQWPWTRIAALVAPRPLLFVNSDEDPIFPMDANERVIARLERLYSLFGAGDAVDAVVSVGGHAYREDIRKAAYRFINTHLKHDPRPVTDSETAIVSEGSRPGPYPIPPEALRVFPADSDIPADQLNTTIDQHFVPLGQPPVPQEGRYDAWRSELISDIRQASFRWFAKDIPAARKSNSMEGGAERLESEQGVQFVLRFPDPPPPRPGRDIFMVVLNPDEAGTSPDWIQHLCPSNSTVVLCEPRGLGVTRWTKKNPPNYVERSHVLLGRTVDAGRVWDVIAAAQYLAGSPGTDTPSRRITVGGHGPAAVIAAYAAVLSNAIHGATLHSPVLSHMQPEAPPFLNILRICDIPDVLGLIAPRPLTIVGAAPDGLARTAAVYAAATASQRLVVR
jgi:dienelactone hydrolase